MGVVDTIADALAGKTRPEIGIGSDGGQYIKQDSLTRGQQWVKIGAGLLAGAAKGLAAGKGRNPGAAAAAGVDEGAKLAQQDQQQTPELQKQMLANANYQKMRMDTAEQSWHLTALQHEATQHDIEFAQGQEDRLMKVDGATLLGTAAHPGDISGILKADPNVMESMIKNHQIEILPHYNPDGTQGGIRVFKMPDGYRNTIEPAGSVFHTFDSTTGQYTEHHASDPMTAGELDDYETAASNKAQAYHIAQANLAKTQAETDASKATASKTPSEILKTKADTAEAYAKAAESRANANKANIESVGTGADPNLTHETIVNGMMDGSVDITKAVGIFKDPHAREQYIAEAKQRDPNWSMQKYQSMMKLRDDLTSGKLGDQTQSFNAFLGHASSVDHDVNSLRNGNSPLINHTINWLRTNAAGDPTVTNMLPEIDATRNEFQNFLANHALQKSEIERGQKLLSEDQSPAQMQGAIKDFMQVALTKLGAIQYRAAQTFGDRTPNLISPQNVQAVRNLGLDKYAANYGLMPHATPTAAPPPRPPSVPANATWNPQGNNGKGSWQQ